MQVNTHIRCVLVPKITILLQTLIDDAFEFNRQVRVEANRRSGRSIENCFEDDTRALAPKWQLAGTHFIEHSTERKNVATGIQLLRSHLLWRHVCDGAERTARAGQMI